MIRFLKGRRSAGRRGRVFECGVTTLPSRTRGPRLARTPSTRSTVLERTTPDVSVIAFIGVRLQSRRTTWVQSWTARSLSLTGQGREPPRGSQPSSSSCRAYARAHGPALPAGVLPQLEQHRRRHERLLGRPRSSAASSGTPGSARARVGGPPSSSTCQAAWTRPQWPAFAQW
jgi:hypothetical protein